MLKKLKILGFQNFAYSFFTQPRHVPRFSSDFPYSESINWGVCYTSYRSNCPDTKCSANFFQKSQKCSKKSGKSLKKNMLI